MSSSGLSDGLGRRSLAFDREEGTMLEQLNVRPELAAFEALLRDRLGRLAAMEDERIARPRTLARTSNGALLAVSEFVPGTRLSDLLDAAESDGIPPGVDAALGFLLDVLPALCGLHAGAGFAHGTIAPPRTVITPAGQIVLLDAIYGDALSHLRFSRRRLWTEFGVAARPGAATSVLDASTDIAQATLSAVMLVLGRPLRLQDLIDGLTAVAAEVAEIAQIRGNTAFAQRFSGFIVRALPFFHDPPFENADDALIEARQLASDLGGVHACRQALIDFLERMEPPANGPAEADAAEPDVLESNVVEPDVEEPDAPTGQPDALQLLDEGLITVVMGDADEENGRGSHEFPWDATTDAEAPVADAADAEIDLDAIAGEDPDAFDEPLTLDATAITERGIDGWPDLGVDDERLAPRPASALHDEPETGIPDRHQDHSDDVLAASVAEPMGVPEPATTVAAAPNVEPAPVPEQAASPSPPDGAPAPWTRAAEAEAPHGAAATPPITDVIPSPAVRARRAKKSRSARARKDRLRSARADAPPASPAVEAEAQEPAEKPQGGGWLVRPDRVPVFEPVPEAAPTPGPHVVPFPTPQTPTIARAPALAVAPAPPINIYPAPQGPPPPVPPFGLGVPAPPPVPPTPYAVPWSAPPVPPLPAPPGVSPGVAAPAGVPPLAPPAFPGVATVKLKDAPRARTVRPSPMEDIYAAPLPPPVTDTPAQFPWKIAAAVVAVILVAVLAGRAYLPARTVDDEAVDAAAAIAAAAEAKPPFAPPAAPTGRLEIDTQPAGARVLLNGKAAGQTPLTLDAVPAGRHTVTFLSASGSVQRTVRVEPGRTVKLDVPIFSGWVGIFAPFVVEVSAGGRKIGTNEEPRLMLSPGRHQLTLVNRELGYRAVQSVEIEPGQVRTLTLDPRGTANLNATPWAEVWVDGQKAGETPLANLTLPLGTREIVFRHPQHGERRATVTVRADRPAVLSVDMSQ